ncbi:hypothetical protein HQ524_03935 [Candidatus Uhrbacteria bacterium]|nr:hypothetical protein [Candidatus Uhrbacteria bacterium]
MNFLPHNPHSEQEDTWALVGIVLFGITILITAIFTSPWLLVGGVFFLLAAYLAWKQPMWMVTFLCAWWPLEPFILKWLGDDLYVFARYFSEVMIYVLVGVVLIGVMTGKYKRRSTPVDLPLALFLVMIVVSILLNTLPVGEALLGTRQIIRFMLLFYVIVILYPRRFWVKRIAIVIFAMALLQSLIGISQAVVGGDLDTFLLPSERHTFGELQLTEGTVQFWDPGQRVFGTMGRYDRLGTFLALALLLSVGFVYEGNRKHKWLNLGLLAILAVPTVILTYSRSAWFGLVFGGLAIAALRKDKRVFVATGIAVALLAGFFALSSLQGTLADTPRQTVAERFFEAFSYNRFRGEYLGLGRVYWIVQTPTQIVPYGMVSALFGWGPGQYGGGAVSALGNTRVYDATGLPFGVYGTEGYIDNNWFSLWGETGTLGMLFYLWAYIGLIVAAWKVARSSKITLTRAVSAGYVGIAMAVGLNAFLATFLEVRTLAPYLWILAGFVVVLASREKLIETS